MRIKRLAEDFKVEELVDLPVNEGGAYAYYQVEKWGQPTLLVRDALADHLKVTSSNVVFLGSRDKNALAIQYASIRQRVPEVVEGADFVARLAGWGPRALRTSDLKGHRFTIVARDLPEAKARTVAEVMAEIVQDGMPNYFDVARFGSFSEEGFIGKAILMRDAEEAIRLYLSAPMAGDPREFRTFKQLVRSHWGQWGYLLHQAPRPSNFRSVLTFLKDHPQKFRKALNLIQDRLLSIYLVAYQSWLWNGILGRYLDEKTQPEFWIEVAGCRLPLTQKRPPLPEHFRLSMPNLTAVYPPDLAPIVDAVLAEEGITLEDFKARVLRRVYLPKGERRVWFSPLEVEVGAPEPDGVFTGRWSIPVAFTLLPGHYATLVMKALAARLGESLRVR